MARRPAPSSEPDAPGTVLPSRGDHEPAPRGREREGARAAPIEFTYDATNERVVIGAAIASAEKRDVLVRTIGADEFLVTEHPPIWRALRAMSDRAMVYDRAVLLRLVADNGGEIAEEYLAGLEGESPSPNLEWHVETLRWDATRARALRGPVPELIRDLRDPRATPEAIRSAARAVHQTLESGGGRRHIHRPEELRRAYRAELEARAARGNFYPTKMCEALDARLTEGAMPGKTCIIAGLPGSGKSTLAASLAFHLAVAGRRVLYGAWEMGTIATLDVLCGSMVRVAQRDVVQTGGGSAENRARLFRAADWITERVKFMDNPFLRNRREKGRPDNNRNLDIIEGYIAESGCDVGIFDLWERSIVDLSYEGVTGALYRQQAMFAEYNIWGVLLHQLRLKDVERRADKRPTRDAVKGTGAFVEIADLLFGVHRDAMFKSVPDDNIELINLKQRRGEAFWAIRFGWAGDLALVSGGEEVPYDPGLESAAAGIEGEVKDVGEIRTRNKRKPSRRDAG